MRDIYIFLKSTAKKSKMTVDQNGNWKFEKIL